MKERKATAKEVGDLIAKLSNAELVALTDRRNTRQLQEFLGSLIGEAVQRTFVEYLGDSEVLKRFPQFAGLVPKYRQLATELGYSGPVAWRVKAGFTLKEHASKAGPCYKDFGYLQDWEFEDEPTRESVVFWIPWLMSESTSKTADEQMELLSEMRKRLELPDHHLSSLGSVALNAVLILAEHKRSGDRVPLERYWIRTDTRGSVGDRLALGDFDEDGLHCDHWDWDDDRHDGLGCFALGVEALGD